MKIFDAFKTLFKTFIFEATAKLIDGKDIRIDGNLESGSKVYLITEETEIPMPDGEWTLEDGTVINTVGGMIEEVKEPDPEESVEPPVVETPVEDVIEEAAIDPSADTEPSPEDMPATVDEDTTILDLETRIAELEKKLDLIISKNEKIEADYEAIQADYSKTKEEFSSKFERVMVVEPVKQNEIAPINSNNKSSMLGSYEEIYKK